MDFFDEMMSGADGVRKPYAEYNEWFSQQDPKQLRQKLAEAETLFRRSGITFAVYGEQEAAERIIPFDIVPRIISGREWRALEQGIEQRVVAINAFLRDIYHRQEIIRAGRIPRELIVDNAAFSNWVFGSSSFSFFSGHCRSSGSRFSSQSV